MCCCLNSYRLTIGDKFEEVTTGSDWVVLDQGFDFLAAVHTRYLARARVVSKRVDDIYDPNSTLIFHEVNLKVSWEEYRKDSAQTNAL